MENKQAAFELYRQGWEQKRIASALRIAETTVSAWKRRHNWEKKREGESQAKETSEQLLWELVNYQLNALKQKKEEWIAAGEIRLINKNDIDALSKMYAAVKGKQHAWAQIVELMNDFVSFAEQHNFSLAKKMLPMVDDFLMLKRKGL